MTQLLNKKAIEFYLPNHIVSQLKINIYDEVTSTQQLLKNSSSPHAIECCLAEMQTQGHGRFMRHWHSPYGKHIYLSFAYPFQKKIQFLSGLSLVVSLAVAATVECIGSAAIVTKWPNDVLYQQKKLAGILIELIKHEQWTRAVIGVGLNVHHDEHPSYPATSLETIFSKTYDRNEIAALLITTLLAHLKQFEQTGFASFKPAWEARDCLIAKEITLVSGQKEISGKVLGVNDQGNLLLQTKNNEIESVSGGEATILKKSF